MTRKWCEACERITDHFECDRAKHIDGCIVCHICGSHNEDDDFNRRVG